MGVVKNGWGHSRYGTFISAVSQKGIEECYGFRKAKSTSIIFGSEWLKVGVVS